MILELKSSSRRMHGGNSSSRNSRKRNQRMLLLLLLALAAAALSTVLLHQLREGHIYGFPAQDQDQDRDQELKLILKRERLKSNEMTKKLEDRRLKIYVLRTQRSELIERLVESKATVDRLQKIQKEMETILAEKQNQINRMSEKTEEPSISRNLQARQSKARIEEAKGRLVKPSPRENDTTKGDDQQQAGTPRAKSDMDHEGIIAEGLGEVTEDQQKQNVTNSSENETSEEEGLRIKNRLKTLKLRKGEQVEN